MKGTVKWFNRDKGYGFINGEDGQDYFVHWKQLPEGITLNENDAVSFEAVQTDRGMQAQDVTVGAEEPAEDSASEEPAEDFDSEEPADEDQAADEASDEEKREDE